MAAPEDVRSRNELTQVLQRNLAFELQFEWLNGGCRRRGASGILITTSATLSRCRYQLAANGEVSSPSGSFIAVALRLDFAVLHRLSGCGGVEGARHPDATIWRWRLSVSRRTWVDGPEMGVGHVEGVAANQR